MISLNDQLWLLGGAFYSIHRKYYSTATVRIVSRTLLQFLDPGVHSGSGATEEAVGLDLLLSNLTLLPERLVQARTEYTLLRRPPIRIESVCKSFPSEKNFL